MIDEKIVMLRASFAAFVLAATVVLTPMYAAAEEKKRPLQENKISAFVPAVPPRPVPAEPFIADGDKVTNLAAYRGRGVVLNFWATWCSPCVHEMPSLDRLQEKLKKDGGRVVVLAVSLDRGGASVVERFFKTHNLKNLRVFLDARKRLGRKMRVSGIPVTILIDANGMEQGRVVGAAEWDSPEALALIDSLITPAAS